MTPVTPPPLSDLLHQRPTDGDVDVEADETSKVKIPSPVADVLHAIIDRIGFHHESQVLAAHDAVNAHSDPSPVEDVDTVVSYS